MVSSLSGNLKTLFLFFGDKAKGHRTISDSDAARLSLSLSISLLLFIQLCSKFQKTQVVNGYISQDRMEKKKIQLCGYFLFLIYSICL